MKITEIIQEFNPLYLNDLKNEMHHSIFINEASYKILILRGLNITDDGLGYLSSGFVINNDKHIYKFDREGDCLDKSDIPFSELYKLLSPIFERNDKIVMHYIDEIDKLEDVLFGRKSTRIFMDVWFDLKKDLTRMDRYFERSLKVIGQLHKEFSKVDDFQKVEFADLMSAVSHLQQSLKNQISRLDALYNYFASIKNDKLNNNLYLLTVLSAVFLPLNLIVGFFGMNTENLLFKDNPMGTQYVIWIVSGSFLLTLFGLPLIRIIDHRILKIFLGRYNMYNKISGKIDRLFKLD
ncbi:MAG: hypothetical protein CME69_08655 [Halobacteriovorax sp.]|nr:hypothetical protein [Halobacteriovorax sp.]